MSAVTRTCSAAVRLRDLDNPTMRLSARGETATIITSSNWCPAPKRQSINWLRWVSAIANRIGVGGHSYGAFMTANLLAHSRLFRAGFAESGAYNRSLTRLVFRASDGPFGKCGSYAEESVLARQ